MLSLAHERYLFTISFHFVTNLFAETIRMYEEFDEIDERNGDWNNVT